MHNEIAHMGVIDAPVRRVTPSGVSLRKVRVDADDIERLQISELDPAERRKLAPEYEMEQPSFAAMTCFRFVVPRPRLWRKAPQRSMRLVRSISLP